ncbi:alpha/beta hydrolase [Candidatus Acetothermia bacterium]|nr:alpha/beta hydrolase [Candidatus Acetothermia bacterium]MBI3642694.1 alpha/beta hydrolase [Candidatus Acetothermia bacterium]
MDQSRLNGKGTAPRPMLTDLWYPAENSSVEEEIWIGPPKHPLFSAGWAAQDAEVSSASERFPLVMLSHGTGGSSRQMGWLATHLARHGYLVAGVNHHGNTSIEPYTVEGFARVWERPQDLRAVLDLLLQDSWIGPRINIEQIGVAGFSLGGYTAIALAGGLTDFHELKRVDKKSGRLIDELVPPEFPNKEALAARFQFLIENDTTHKKSFRDKRMRAAFAIAPVLGEAFTASGLAPISIPVKIVVGEADQLAPAEANAIKFARHLKDSELEILKGKVAHYTFIAECTAHGKQTLPFLCIDDPSVDRKALHNRVSEMAAKFFDAHL